MNIIILFKKSFYNIILDIMLDYKNFLKYINMMVFFYFLIILFFKYFIKYIKLIKLIFIYIKSKKIYIK